MKKYLLLCYNSGGYKSYVQIEFDGTIERKYRPDPDHPDTLMTISYFQVTDRQGNVTEENSEFMDKLIYKSLGYHESFLVTEIIEINSQSLEEAIKENDTNLIEKLTEAGAIIC